MVVRAIARVVGDLQRCADGARRATATRTEARPLLTPAHKKTRCDGRWFGEGVVVELLYGLRRGPWSGRQKSFYCF